MLRAARRRILGFGRARVSAAAERGPTACDLRYRERSDERMLRGAGIPILGFGRWAWMSAAAEQGYNERVGGHFENSRNVESFDKNDLSVGTALIGDPSDGMKLRIKVDDATERVEDHFENSGNVGSFGIGSFDENDPSVGTVLIDSPSVGVKFQIKVDDATEMIVDVFYYGFGYSGSTASIIIEWVKGKHVDEVLDLSCNYSEVVESLNIGPVEIYYNRFVFCIIEAAAKDYKAKNAGQLLYSEVVESLNNGPVEINFNRFVFCVIEAAAKDYKAKNVGQLLQVLKQIELQLMQRPQQIIE